jgi:hypothetical protein
MRLFLTYFYIKHQQIIALILCFTTTIVIHSQKTLPKEGGMWLAYFGDNKINQKIGIHSELQLRNIGLEGYNSTLLVRTGLNCYIKPYAMTSVGYAFIYNKPNGNHLSAPITSEHRIWEQLILRQKTLNLFLEHRFRLEQRFIENKTASTSRLDHRIRYRFQALVPMYAIDPRLRHFFFSGNNEVMLNFRDNPAQIYDRNRLFLGLGYQVSPKLNFQMGYMNQWAQQANSTEAWVDNLFIISVSYNMDDLMQTFFKRPE